MDWTQVIGNVASGGLLGLIGSVAGEVVNFFKRKQEHQQAVERMRLEGELNAAKTAGEVAVARERGAAEAFTESVRAEGSLKGEHRWATTYRAITRPSLTHMGMLASVLLAFFPPYSESGQIIAATINAYTGMMIAWWFGQRAIDRSTTSWGNSTASASVSTKK